MKIVFQIWHLRVSGLKSVIFQNNSDSSKIDTGKIDAFNEISRI